MLCLVLLIGHAASCYQPQRTCVRRFVTSCCFPQYVRPFTVTLTFFCPQKLHVFQDAKVSEDFIPITLDRSKKKSRMPTMTTLKRHFASVDIAGYEYDADTDLLFKSEVTGFEDEHGNNIDLQDETDEEKYRIIKQLHP